MRNIEEIYKTREKIRNERLLSSMPVEGESVAVNKKALFRLKN